MIDERLKWANPRGFGILYVRRSQPGAQGWLWTSLGGVRRPTGIKWPDDDRSLQRRAKAKGMKILEEMARAHMHPDLGPAPPPNAGQASEPSLAVHAPAAKATAVVSATKTVTLYDALKEFKDAKFSDFSRSIQSRYRMAFGHFLLDEKRGNLPMDFDAIKQRIIEKKNLCTLDETTKQKVLYKLSAFLDYCVASQWLSANPMKAIGIAKVEREGDTRIWEQKELDRITGWLCSEGYKLNALQVRFMALTGLRISETLKLRWEHFNDRSFLVHGKRTSANRSGRRYFPFLDSNEREAVPGLLGLLGELRQYEKVHKGYVFPWRSAAAVQRIFKRCIVTLRLDDGRSIHNLRKTAIWYWREELGWNVELRSEAAGHSVDVQMKHYARRRDDRELALAIARARDSVAVQQ